MEESDDFAGVGVGVRVEWVPGVGEIKVNCQLLDPNPRKYHVREMELSAIRENIMSANISCPTVNHKC